jgi:hypothetical protein
MFSALACLAFMNALAALPSALAEIEQIADLFGDVRCARATCQGALSLPGWVTRVPNQKLGLKGTVNLTPARVVSASHL